jgi:hypothetical protein
MGKLSLFVLFAGTFDLRLIDSTATRRRMIRTCER